MMKEAEAHADEDKARREEAEVRNTAESLQYATQKFLSESGDKLPEDKRSEVETALAQLQGALGGSDIAAIKAAQEKLSTVSQEAGSALYEAQAAAANDTGASGASGAGGGSASADDDSVVDAEVVDEGPAEESK
jgi:molecular chaperone DnaK